jgi:hypothetical protein
MTLFCSRLHTKVRTVTIHIRRIAKISGTWAYRAPIRWACGVARFKCIPLEFERLAAYAFSIC